MGAGAGGQEGTPEAALEGGRAGWPWAPVGAACQGQRAAHRWGRGGGLKRRGSSHMFSGRGCHDGSLSSFRRRKQVGLIERGGFRASCRPLPWARSVSLTVSCIYQKGSSSLLLGQRPAPFQAPSLADAWGRETSPPGPRGAAAFAGHLAPGARKGCCPHGLVSSFSLPTKPSAGSLTGKPPAEQRGQGSPGKVHDSWGDLVALGRGAEGECGRRSLPVSWIRRFEGLAFGYVTTLCCWE